MHFIVLFDIINSITIDFFFHSSLFFFIASLFKPSTGQMSKLFKFPSESHHKITITINSDAPIKGLQIERKRG
jgi:hypothetical protein